MAIGDTAICKTDSIRKQTKAGANFRKELDSIMVLKTHNLELMEKTILKKPLKFLPNLRFEKANAQSGYNWGKPVKQSNILKMMGWLKPEKSVRQWLDLYGINENDSISERWIISDDQQHPSMVHVFANQTVSFHTVLQRYGKELLGEKHYNHHGPFLKVLMKQIDTHSSPHQGSLSVQVHPNLNHPRFPSKIEMWKGSGKIYLGWNQDMEKNEIQKSVQEETLEQFLNSVEMNQSLVFVSGGTVHAIRYDTFINEWSEAPASADILKGNIKNATIALYDKTDGKKARPGKEKPNEAINIMEDAGTLKKAKDFIREPETLYIDKNDNEIKMLFQVPKVIQVEEITLTSEIKFDAHDKGFPCFLENGKILVLKEEREIDEIFPGEECFFPASLGSFSLRTITNEAKLYRWFIPD